MTVKEIAIETLFARETPTNQWKQIYLLLEDVYIWLMKLMNVKSDGEQEQVSIRI